MPATRATTLQQRQEMARLAAEDMTLPAIATDLKVSVWTARKWTRRAQHGGLTALVSVLGRPPTGPLAACQPLVRYVALRLKRQHPKWGAAYVVKKMKEHPALQGQALPEATSLWRYWRSFGDRLFPKRPRPEPKPAPAVAAHEQWQLDFKESVPVPGVGPTTFTQARDAFGRATVLHRVHPAEQAEQRIVKPTGAQVQADCRIAFRQWGLPDAIQTDRASLFVDADPTPFPTPLTLWWVGLGITPRLIPRRQPQANGSVERSHRTLVERTLDGQIFAGAAQLQQQVDADWHELNCECPSRARGCQGQPPVRAHPELLVPRREYRPEWEADLFDLTRVDCYLTTFTWLRTVSASGQVMLGGERYGLGVAWAKQAVSIRFDPDARTLVFTQIRPLGKAAQSVPELTAVARPAQGLSREDLIGIAQAVEDLPGRQLSFPWSMFAPQQPLPEARLSAMPAGA